MLILHNKRGDTIVEVLIALAVLGSVLVGGYSIATRSINSVRASQERGEALKIAESQIEQLRSYLGGVSDLKDTTPKFDRIFIKNNDFLPSPNTFNPETEPTIRAFCYSTVSATVVKFDNLDPVPATSYSSAPVSECVSNSRYRIAIVPSYKEQDPTDKTLSLDYTVTVRWDRVGGGTEESLSLSYRTVVGGATITTGP